MAAQRMLRRRRLTSTLYLGVAKGEETALDAHAWLRCGRTIVIGGPGHQHYVVVNSFADERGVAS